MDLADELAQPVIEVGTAVAGDRSLEGGTIDLLSKSAVKPRCPRASANEIVVCAPDQEAFRVRPLPQTYEGFQPDAEIGVGQNATVGATAEAAGVGGWQSNRIMVRFKLKF